MKYDTSSILLMTALVSFLGFWLENIWIYLTKGYMDNRNMKFPFLLGYGLAVIGIYFVFGTPENFRLTRNQTEAQNYILYFLTAIILVSIGEIALGKFVEKFLGFEYWNYERLPLHITKYTSVPTSTGFALIITLFMGKFFTPIMQLLGQIPKPFATFLALALTVIMIHDFFASFKIMYRTKSLNITKIRYFKRKHC